MMPSVCGLITGLGALRPGFRGALVYGLETDGGLEALQCLRPQTGPLFWSPQALSWFIYNLQTSDPDLWGGGELTLGFWACKDEVEQRPGQS